MVVNRFFNKFNRSSEQSLINQLNIEAIQIHGRDYYYLPREHRKLDLIYGEDVLSKFSKYFEIEMYLKSVNGFDGDKDFLSKFGLEIRDQVTLTVSKTRFEEVLEDVRNRPMEGDLIFFPFNSGLFEVKFVENQSVFYQNGELYVYELKCEAYQFSHEDFSTGIEEIDSIPAMFESTIELSFQSPSTAFTVDSVIYQGASLNAATARATVVSYANHKAIVKTIFGEFKAGATTDGTIINTLTTVDERINLFDTLDNSKQINTEANASIDFSEDNPFSEDL